MPTCQSLLQAFVMICLSCQLADDYPGLVQLLLQILNFSPKVLLRCIVTALRDICLAILDTGYKVQSCSGGYVAL